MASKCGIMDLTIYSAPVMYSYFTHPVVVDNFMLLSPQLAWPANQCPLKQLSVHMSLDPVSINSASVHISTLPLTVVQNCTTAVLCVHSRRLLQADAHYGDTLTSSDFTVYRQ